LQRKRKLNNLETEAECSDKCARKRGPSDDSFEDSSTDEGESETALERKRLKKLYTVSGKPWCRKLNMFVPPQPLKMKNWLDTFKGWSSSERLVALDHLIDTCEAPQVRHMMQVIEPQFQRDFISLLPKEVNFALSLILLSISCYKHCANKINSALQLALHVLSFLEPADLLRAAQTCRYWRLLTEDNLLWREKCKAAGIDAPYVSSKLV